MEYIFLQDYKSNKACISNIIEKSLEVARNYGLASERLFDYRLIIDELCTNCYKHAYGRDEGVINIKYFMKGDYFVTCVEDQGIGFNPGIISENEKKLKSELLKPGGRGLILVKELVDRFEIVSTPFNGTQVKVFFKVQRQVKIC